MLLNGSLIMKRAKVYQEEMNFERNNIQGTGCRNLRE
jgi:hypothetical protein